MGVRGRAWAGVGGRGRAWVCVGVRGCAWVCVGVGGCVGVCVGVCGCVGVCERKGKVGAERGLRVLRSAPWSWREGDVK